MNIKDEKTDEYQSMQLRKAEMELYNAFLETWLGKSLVKTADKLNKLLNYLFNSKK